MDMSSSIFLWHLSKNSLVKITFANKKMLHQIYRLNLDCTNGNSCTNVTFVHPICEIKLMIK